MIDEGASSDFNKLQRDGGGNDGREGEEKEVLGRKEKIRDNMINFGPPDGEVHSSRLLCNKRVVSSLDLPVGVGFRFLWLGNKDCHGIGMEIIVGTAGGASTGTRLALPSQSLAQRGPQHEQPVAVALSTVGAGAGTYLPRCAAYRRT